MAKVPFSKLDIKLNNMSNKVAFLNSKNEEIIFDVKYYLPVQEKLELISRIINYSIDENNFYNPIRIQIYTVLEIIYAYTNLNFTEKQKEDPFKLYDLLISSGIFKTVIDSINEDDWIEIKETVMQTIENIYKYKNSAMGILENLSTDYSNLNFDLEQIQEKLSNPENLHLLKEIVPLMNVNTLTD